MRIIIEINIWKIQRDKICKKFNELMRVNNPPSDMSEDQTVRKINSASSIKFI